MFRIWEILMAIIIPRTNTVCKRPRTDQFWSCHVRTMESTIRTARSGSIRVTRIEFSAEGSRQLHFTHLRDTLNLLDKFWTFQLCATCSRLVTTLCLQRMVFKLVILFSWGIQTHAEFALLFCSFRFEFRWLSWVFAFSDDYKLLAAVDGRKWLAAHATKYIFINSRFQVIDLPLRLTINIYIRYWYWIHTLMSGGWNWSIDGCIKMHLVSG